MKLNYEQIRNISLGVVRAEETQNGVRLYRFTEEQQEIYRMANVVFYDKSFATSGIKLHFETDSRFLFLKVNVLSGTPRTYFSFDVMVNGKPIGYLDNFSDITLPRDYTQMQFPHGEFSKNFPLGEGIKKICVYLPWSVAVEIRELSIEDGAFINAIKPVKKLLVFGDSITQGYDALRPSNRYAARLAEALDAEEINKAIGGEIFFPPLAESRDDFMPDYITVAYGTNDWSNTEEENFRKRCKAFYAALSKNYPKATIFAITPIWRKDHMESRAFGKFCNVAADIESIVKPFENIICIHGFDFVPHAENYFADFRLHPNDEGFDHYFQGLCNSVRKIMAI